MGSQRGPQGTGGPITGDTGAGVAHHIIAKEESGCCVVPLECPSSLVTVDWLSAKLPRGTVQPLKQRPEQSRNTLREE